MSGRSPGLAEVEVAVRRGTGPSPSPSASEGGSEEEDNGGPMSLPAAMELPRDSEAAAAGPSTAEAGLRAHNASSTGGRAQDSVAGRRDAGSRSSSSSLSSAVATAGSARPGESGESTTNFLPGLGGGVGGFSLMDVQRLLQGVQDLLAGQRGGAPASPVGAWSAQVRDQGQATVTPVVSGGEVSPAVVAASANDGVRLADSAKGEVYVCFEGPLGAHLRAELREKMWKGEYVEIFSLLPLEKI